MVSYQFRLYLPFFTQIIKVEEPQNTFFSPSASGNTLSVKTFLPDSAQIDRPSKNPALIEKCSSFCLSLSYSMSATTENIHVNTVTCRGNIDIYPEYCRIFISPRQSVHGLSMTQKDYVKEYLSFLRILMSGLIGTMFLIALYNLQTSGFFSIASVSIVFLGLVFILLSLLYFRFMNELKDLP